MSELRQGVTFCTPEYAEAAERWAARVRASWGNVFTYTLIDLLAESRAKAKDA